MRRGVLLAVLIVASGSLFFGSRAVRMHVLLAAETTPKTFTAEFRENRFSPDGKRSENVVFTYARRTDGSTVTVYRDKNPKGNPIIVKHIVKLAIVLQGRPAQCTPWI